MNPVQADMIEQCVEEFESFFQALNRHTLQDVDLNEDVKTNPIWQEMQDRFALLSKKYPLVTRKNCQIDVLEVYCSAESNLTAQCTGRDLKSMRFGLKQGDLSYADGRQRLFDALFFLRPKHVWMSPKCKAWCKWSQFNAARSLKSAEKVMVARQEDEIHLQLCEAVFYFHLEQPVGSEMIGEGPLQSVHAHTLRSRCDLCTAGNLCHPNTKLHMQKGTILTTSNIMAQYMSKFRCQHNHEHSEVAGKYVCRDGTRKNVSEFTEIYTPIFANRLARSIQASIQCAETSIAQQCHAFGETAEQDESEGTVQESELKRRRLSSKVARPPAFYPEPKDASDDVLDEESQSTLTLDDVLQECLKAAPRVGTMVLEEGPLFDMIQRHFSEHQVRLIEVCKGADRFRKPPVRLNASEAPWRKSFGLHRHHLSVVDAGEWEDWRAMSNRQMCSKSPPFRVLVTVFAKSAREASRSLKRMEMESDDPRTRKKVRTDPWPDENLTDEKREIHPKAEDIESELQKSACHHGPKFLALAREEKQWISKIHHNLGHPSASKLQIVLKQQGYGTGMIEAITDFKCSTCHEMQNPRVARPSVLSEPREFNDCVGCDAVTWTSASGKPYTFLHFIDMATNFQQGCVVNQMDAESLFEAFQSTWLHWAGPCKQLIIDNDSALCSEKFSQLAQEQNIHLRVVAAYAHWQMGKTERHGDIVQHMLMKYDHDRPILNEAMFRQVLTQCFVAKNSLARSKGYTPEILVLGKSQALPGSLSDNPFSSSQYVADAETPEGIAFREKLLQRECARKAFVVRNCEEPF